MKSNPDLTFARTEIAVEGLPPVVRLGYTRISDKCIISVSSDTVNFRNFTRYGNARNIKHCRAQYCTLRKSAINLVAPCIASCGEHEDCATIR